MKGRSTIVPLMVAVHHWHQFLERKQQVMSVFFDIRKAFNNVPHQALLNKLSSLDIPFILFRCMAHWLSNIKAATCCSWLVVSLHLGSQLSQVSLRALS